MTKKENVGRANMVIFQDALRQDAVWLHLDGPAFRLQEVVNEVWTDSLERLDAAQLTSEIIDRLFITGHYVAGRDGIGLEGTNDQRYPTVVVDALAGETWLDKERPTQTSKVVNKPGEPEREWSGRYMLLTPEEQEFVELARLKAPRPEYAAMERPEMFARVKHETDCARVSNEIASYAAELERRIEMDQSIEFNDLTR